MDCNTPGFPVLHCLPEFAQTHVHWVGEAIQSISSSVTSFSFYPQSFPAAGSFPMSQLFAFNSSRYWSFSFSISPSNVYSRLMSFKADWFDLLAVQGTLKSLSLAPQFESTNCSVLSLLYGPTLTSVHDDCIAFTIQIFVSKATSLLLNMLSRFVIAFLPRSKHLLISWLHSPFTIILEPKKIKSATVFTFSPSICHKVMGTGCHDLSFLKVEF